MSYSKTFISNIALANIGVSLRIVDVDTENSAEADVCRLFFDHVTKTLLEMIPWNWASRRVDLQTVDIDTYEDHWAVVYGYPDNCAKLNCIINPLKRTPNREEDKIAFRVVDKATALGKLILCDEANAVAEYNHLILDPAYFSASFAQAHALLLSTMIAPSLRVNADIISTVMANWQEWMRNAISADWSNEQADPQRDSAYETARA